MSSDHPLQITARQSQPRQTATPGFWVAFRLRLRFLLLFIAFFGATQRSVAVLQPEMRINCGGGPYTDLAGQSWTADQFFSGGSTYSTSREISGSLSQPLFQTERSGGFSYRIPVAAGRYRVTLYFAEIYFNSGGKRIFSVNAEGKPVLPQIDIVQAAGAFAATERTFDVESVDGFLDLAFIPKLENPKISAIRIIHLREGPAPILKVTLPPDFISEPVPTETVLSAAVSGQASVDPSYRNLWEQTDGPAVAEIQDPTVASSPVRFTTPGAYTFRFTASCYSSTATSSIRLLVPGDTTGQPPIRIRCGGPAYTDSAGKTWLADQFFKGGGTFTGTGLISGTPDPALYLSERFGACTYSIPVRNGLYSVRIHLAEIYFKTTGSRIFQINAEDKPFAAPLDLIQRFGFMQATALGSLIEVRDSALSLEFLPLLEKPKVSAIEVIPIVLESVPLQVDPGKDVVLNWPGNSTRLEARLNRSEAVAAGASIRWTQVAGVLSAIIESPGALTSLLRLPAPGAYRFKVQASEGSQQANAEVSVLVLEQPLPPFAVQTSASLASATVPVEAQLFAVVTGVPPGQASSPSGSWIQTGGPANARLTNAGTPGCTALLEEPGLYTFRYSATYGGSSATSSVSTLALGDTSGQHPIRIRSGGGAYTDSIGNQWIGDAFFKGGGFFGVTAPVQKTQDPTLYQTERYGAFSYRIPVRNGLYTLRLHFAELWHKNAAQRIFTVNAEGKPILPNLDLFKTAGLLTAWVWSGNLRVADGFLDLDFLPVIENPKVAGIELLPLALDPPPLGVDVGTEQWLHLPMDTLLVQAKPTGTPTQTASANCIWSQVSGPVEAHILTPSALSTQIHFHESGNYRFRATVNSGTVVASSDLSIRVLPVPDPPGVQRIRCGGGAYTDSFNRLWAADNFYIGGSVYTSSGSILATPDPALYLSERSGTSFSYKIPVTNGEYTVRLHFAEIYWTQPQKRLFGVKLADQQVLQNLDLCSLAAPKTAHVLEYTTTVTNDLIELTFNAQLDKAKVSAIEIVPVRNPAHLLHVVIRAPESVVDYSNAGFASLSLSGTQSHTHEFGQVLTRFEWREGTQILSDKAELSIDAPVGSHTYTLTIWDSAQPPQSLHDSVTIEILPASAVRGALASYFASGTATISPQSPSHIEVLPDFKLKAAAGTIGGSNLTTASVLIKGTWTVQKAGNYAPTLPAKIAGALFIDGQPWVGLLPLATGPHALLWKIDSLNISSLPVEASWRRDDNTTGSFLPLSHDQSVLHPQINRMTASGAALGGDVVEINGLGFFPAETLAVLWGGKPLATGILENTSERIMLLAPPGSGNISVQIQTSRGMSNPVPYAYQAGAAPVLFKSRSVFSLPGPTQAAWGPDGRLYIASLTGAVTVLEFDEQYNVTQSQVLPGVQNTPAYNAIGIGFNPWESAAAFNIYLSHVRLFVTDGRSNVRPSAYLGKVSALASPQFLPKPLISGLPSTNHDHGINGIAFDNQGQLYVAVGGQTNAGIPNVNLGYLDESPLSAAILRAPVGRKGFNGAVSYLDAKTSLPSPDQNDSATAIAVDGSDLRVHAKGLRNCFGIVWATNGKLYGTDNGPNTGFGAASLSAGTQMGDPVTDDKVLLLGKNHYYGHPNRNRGRFDPRENRYAPPMEFSAPEIATKPMTLLSSSRDGIEEYRATTFGGALRGALLVQEWNGSLSALGLSADGRKVETILKNLWGTQRGLGVLCGPGGAILAVDYTGSQITVSLPDDQAATGMVAYDIFPWRAPAEGDSPFVIGGKQFGNLQNTSVSIGGQQARLSSVTPQRIKGTIPAVLNPTAGFLPVLVSSGGKTSVIPEGFRYLIRPGQGLGIWKDESPSPVAAGATMSAEVGGLYYNLTEDCSAFLAFNPVTGSWFASFPPPPIAVTDASLVATAQELVLIGKTAPASNWTVQFYAPTTRTWRQGASGPWNSSKPAVTVLGNSVFALGGEISGAASQVAAVFDADKNQWRTLPQMPLACAEAAAAVQGGTLWIFGGPSGSPGLGVQAFQPDTGQWTVVSDTSSTALRNRFGARAIAFAEEVYLIGGRFDSGEALRNVDVFWPQLLKWRADSSLPEPAWGVGITTNENEIFVTGGRNKSGALKTTRNLVR